MKPLKESFFSASNETLMGIIFTPVKESFSNDSLKGVVRGTVMLTPLWESFSNDSLKGVVRGTVFFDSFTHVRESNEYLIGVIPCLCHILVLKFL